MCSISSVQKGSGKLASWRASGTDRCQGVPVFFFLEVSMNMLVSASWDVGLPYGALWRQKLPVGGTGEPQQLEEGARVKGRWMETFLGRTDWVWGWIELGVEEEHQEGAGPPERAAEEHGGQEGEDLVWKKGFFRHLLCGVRPVAASHPSALSQSVALSRHSHLTFASETWI